MLFSPLVLKKSQLVFNRVTLSPFLKKLEKKNVFLKNSSLTGCVQVNFVSNNIYCTFWSVSGKRTFRVWSAGMKIVKTSKRRLFFYSKPFLESFFLELRQWRQQYRKKGASLFISLKIPKKFRKIILKLIYKKFAIINFEYSKAFNGCKSKKKRRKKRLGFRKFK